MMNVGRTQWRLIFLLVLVYAVHTAICGSKQLQDESKSKLKNKKVDTDADSSMRDMLLTVATVIQRCVDDRTMSNKQFKQQLDNMYSNTIEPRLKSQIKKYNKQVNRIQKKFKEDKKLLKIIKKLKDNNTKNQ